MVTININNTYWNGNGKYQQFVNEILDSNKIDELNISKTLKNEYHKMVHSYYRFYNDGDRPRHAIFEFKNDNEISLILEDKINEVIEKVMDAVDKASNILNSEEECINHYLSNYIDTTAEDLETWYNNYDDKKHFCIRLKGTRFNNSLKMYVMTGTGKFIY